jgi:anti-sigma B factor antagonist
MAKLAIRDRDEVVIASFNETRILDESTIQQIGKEFEKLTLEAAADRKLVLDFTGVEFMSSAMIGQILRLHKRCKADKVKLRLSCIPPSIMEVFNLMKLPKILDIYPTEDAAIESFDKSGSGGWFRR